MISQILSAAPIGIYPLISLGIFAVVWLLAVARVFRKSSNEWADFASHALSDDKIYNSNNGVQRS